MEDQLYTTTTQCKTWSFGPTTLSNLRSATNAAGVRSIKRGWKRARVEASSSTNTPLATTPIPSNNNTPTPIPADPSTIPDPEPLSPSEELTLVNYYMLRLMAMSDIFSFPSSVKATACIFLSRFHLHHSVHSYHPKHLLTTILFLATKTENNYLSTAEFCKRIPKLTPEAVLKYEFKVAGGIGWDFEIRHPLRGADGGIMELLTALGSNSSDLGLQTLKEKLGQNPSRRVTDAAGRMKGYLTKEALVSDVYYHYTPPQIFLGALWLADKELAEAYIEWRFGENSTMGRPIKKKKKERKGKERAAEDEPAAEASKQPALAPKLVPAVIACAEMMLKAQEYEKIPVDVLKRIDKKLHRCQNPQKFLGAGSPIGIGNDAPQQPKKQAEEAPPPEKKRKTEDDMFGGSLR
ncbi:hypothetical protein TWF106_000316 [Orbilia oligospora]|nr:hypothetical protein TWF679_001858 [Orbilia oligospora]KAF3226575.1 hypothetical protein TWF106_000316 [Orbilia oligospora]KAF3261170.1 hypothetical protein TWF192_009102 [Orbilia oligospora]